MRVHIPYLFKRSSLLLIVALAVSIPFSAQNLLTNGDFESGGSGFGFLVTDYTLINPLTGVSNPGQYARTTNPALMNSNFISGGDHTTGTGNMLVFDGTLTGGGFFWTTGNTGGAIGGFTVGTTYTFSYWIKSVSNDVTSDATRSNIGAFFVGVNNINPPILNKLAPLPEEGWQQVSYSFVATSPTILIRLRTMNGGALGNDFAIDDVSITAGGLPLEGSFSSTQPTCPTSTDGSINVNLVGGTLPYTAYTLTGTVSQSNANGIFSNLPQGTYSVTVADATGETYTTGTIVLSAPNDIIVSEPVTICEGETTQLTVSGGNDSYTWTAEPADASLTNPNAATQNVSPLVSTTYTVTSGSESSPENLVFNGDFTLGNVGFITDYTEVANPNPFGVQSSYFIVQNPSAWFTPFASCGDHTTGDGNMMVFDGSTDPTGNIRVWCNETPIPVLPNTDYTFSYYIASVAPENPAIMQAQINGVILGPPINAPGVTCLWTLHSFTWNSGDATTAEICIFNLEFANNGNDFALDDISFAESLTCFYEKSVTVIVNPLITPTFDPVPAICTGDDLAALPTTSINGISGVWSPDLNNTATTTYTFTPNEGSCTDTASLVIEVNELITPIFEDVLPVCLGTTLETLPTISTNGIEGTWLPALNSTATTTYTFTPAEGQCAVNTQLTIFINDAPQFAIVQNCVGLNYTLQAEVSSNADNLTYVWTNSDGLQVGTEASIVVTSSGTYSLVVSQNGCSEEVSIFVSSAYCDIQRGISPNNDGRNDNFDLEAFNVSELQIFNRYGINVYSKVNYRNEWFGQCNKGKELPDGTYFYVINFEDMEPRTGWIYINKEY